MILSVDMDHPVQNRYKKRKNEQSYEMKRRTKHTHTQEWEELVKKKKDKKEGIKEVQSTVRNERWSEEVRKGKCKSEGEKTYKYMTMPDVSTWKNFQEAINIVRKND